MKDTKTLWQQAQDEAIEQHEADVIGKMNYKKVRVKCGMAGFAVRYLPPTYELRVDEELAS